MSVSFMNWKPDTCGCIIEQTHDPQDSTYGVKFSKVISRCSDHAIVPDDQLYGVIYANPGSDQKRKNLLEKYLLANGFNLSDATLNPDGSITYSWKPGIGYSWFFTGIGQDRILNLIITGVVLNGAVKNTIRTFCDTAFGPGKVSL
jgi:hypothetical protein